MRVNPSDSIVDVVSDLELKDIEYMLAHEAANNGRNVRKRERIKNLKHYKWVAEMNL